MALLKFLFCSFLLFALLRVSFSKGISRQGYDAEEHLKVFSEQYRRHVAPGLHRRAVRAASDGVMADYEARVAEYVKEQEQKYGPVDWYDMYGENPVLVENPDYHKYRVFVSVENVEFADPTEDITGPGFEYNQWYHNGGSTDIKSVFEKTTEIQNSYEWSLEEAVNVKTDEKISVHVPIIFDWGNNYTAELAVDKFATQSESETETYSIQNTVTIPAQRSVQATFTIQENHMVVPWTSDVIIGGWVAIWFVDQVDGHWLWFHPTYATANEQFVQEGESVKAQASGNFFGTKGVDHYLVVKEYPLWPNMTDSPTKVTEYEHHPTKPFMLMHGL